MADQAQGDGDAHGYDKIPDPAPSGSKPAAAPPADAGEAWAIHDPQEQANRKDDPAYGSWRDAQMDAFNRDYEDYQKQHPTGSRADFAAWREARGRDGR